jgi:hypothetical protein
MNGAVRLRARSARDRWRLIRIRLLLTHRGTPLSLSSGFGAFRA